MFKKSEMAPKSILVANVPFLQGVKKMKKRKQMQCPELEPIFDNSDYERAQARLESLEDTLRSGADSDKILYRSLRAIVLGTESEELKEGMVVCLLERFFLRVKPSFRN